MNVEMYHAAMARKGENPHRKSTGGLSRADVAFKQDLMNDKVVWYNRCCKDWHAFMKNYHPLYSICRAPKGHPFSRGERFIVFICDIGLAAIFAMVVAMSLKPSEDDTTTDTDSDSDSNISFELLSISFTVNPVEQVVSTVLGIVKSIINGLLKFIAVCPCCLKDGCPGCCRKLFECFGRCLLCIWMVLVVVILVVCGFWANDQDILGDFILNFATNMVTSWISSCFILSCCFRLKWGKEKKSEKKLKKLRVTYIDYQNAR